MWSKETRNSSSIEAGWNLTLETLPSEALGSKFWSWLAFSNLRTLRSRMDEDKRVFVREILHLWYLLHLVFVHK
ncbi:hypothetical protein AVEN_241380-1 [Araneus ventricosus]|uniref:Uncharacterized protein n=1 Tax=Araneus ventricosus TaxID=182803 RepID=A0A4Y2VFM8_ARAVE|nr:hypothetical protein AVEN_241380-1 [Araneus ventricosus]